MSSPSRSGAFSEQVDRRLERFSESIPHKQCRPRGYVTVPLHTLCADVYIRLKFEAVSAEGDVQCVPLPRALQVADHSCVVRANRLKQVIEAIAYRGCFEVVSNFAVQSGHGVHLSG